MHHEQLRYCTRLVHVFGCFPTVRRLLAVTRLIRACPGFEPAFVVRTVHSHIVAAVARYKNDHDTVFVPVGYGLVSSVYLLVPAADAGLVD